MFMPILSGLIVSIDAFFIGISLGLQEKCKFLYLCIINAFLFALCMFGFLIAEQIYELIPFDADIVVGVKFITFGLWYIIHYFVAKRLKRAAGLKTIIPVGIVMSGEAMLITMGLTFLFLP